MEFACKMARHCLNKSILDSGELIPLLEISVLGNPVIKINGEKICSITDLQPAIRNLLALLITASDLKINIEKIQLIYWPESTPEKARSKFDLLLFRMREKFAELMRAHDVNNYLVLKKGNLVIENCYIDAVDFIKKTRKGFVSSRKRDWWQTSNFFFQSINLWNGPLDTQFFSRDYVLDFYHDMYRLLEDSVCSWSKILDDWNRGEEAVVVLEKAFKIDPVNDRIIKKLYELCLKYRNIGRANDFLKLYENNLHMADMDQDIIESMIMDIKN